MVESGFGWGLNRVMESKSTQGLRFVEKAWIGVVAMVDSTMRWASGPVWLVGSRI